MSALRVCRALSIPLLLVVMVSLAATETYLDVETIVERMKEAYSLVVDYRVDMEVRTHKGDASFDTERFVYTFRKPKWIRLDFISPHPGMIIVYPDKNGEAVVRPSGLAHFLTLHLSPNNPLLRVSSGQPVDKTDMGLLIDHLSLSLKDERRGPLKVFDEGGFARIRVLALNHFRPGVLTLYEFKIDKERWLPVEVKEMTPDGSVQREVFFHNLNTNTGVPESLFRLGDEKETAPPGK